MNDTPRIDPYHTALTDTELQEEVAILRRHVTDRRWERMQQVLNRRSRYIAVAVEDIYQPHNGSAVLRSCDAFGVQDVHIIENRNRYRVNPGVELGTAQWLSMYRYPRPHDSEAGAAAAQTRAAVATLHRQGYRVVATTPHRDDVTLAELDLTMGPVALLFGSEKDGLSEVALDLADEYMRIPMEGFVESLNISVSAAVSLHELAGRLRNGSITWQLRERERNIVLARWLRHSVRHAGAILERERTIVHPG
ncbi:MAG TPA: RNA methyltransferase [Alkalispirochaeta sp.]|nr:RNA methyltransferase [Alkalispirochaeta sp.]